MADQMLMVFVVEQVTDIIRDYGVVDTFEGRMLAERVAELVNAVLEKTSTAVPVDACLGINPKASHE